MTRRARALGLGGLALCVALAGGCAASDDDDTAAPATTTTTRPVLPDGACVARMSDPGPGQGGTDTAIVDSHFPSTAVAIAVKYKSTTSNYSGQLDAQGHGEIEFSIGKPTVNFPVEVAVSVNNGQESCTTSFTPH